ncbi:MAG: leucine-rich repeat domain-containing protein, partial [Ruminococcaceae bacterium]|nr:leucine-rich repeat domain-containing protein [Oscillospiraceae bacterium]
SGSTNDGGEEDPDPHTCEGESWVVSLAAGCTTEGKEELKCSCGKVVDTRVIAPSHDEESHEAKEPTCKDVGWNAYVTCKRDGCTYTTYVELPTVAHAYVDKACKWCEAPQPSEGLVYTSAGDGTCTVTDLGSCTDTDVIIPAVSPDGDRVTGIGYRLFYQYYPLTSVKLPEGIERIEKMAFYRCVNLSGLEIPESVESIGEDAFYGCTNQLKYDGGVYYSDRWAVDCADDAVNVILRANTVGVADSAFSACWELETVTVGTQSALRHVGNEAFIACRKLGEISFPASLRSIGESAFQGCNVLTAVTFADGCTLECIERFTFSGCGLLDSFVIPSGVASIGENAFGYCEELESIAIPASVVSIGDSAFSECCKLAEVTFAAQSTLDKIGAYAFAACTALEKIALPASVRAVDGTSFYGCSSVEEITVGAGNTAYRAVDHCLIELASHTLIRGCKTSVIPTDGQVEIIGECAFNSVKELTAIAIPASVEEIGEGAFSACSDLVNVTFGNGSLLKTVGKTAFYNCGNLAAVAIPASVEAIGDNAFQDCTLLASVTFGEDSALRVIGDGAFANCYSIESITIPASVVQIGYQAFIGGGLLSEVTFGETEGWQVKYSLEETSAVAIVPSELSDKTTAKDLLKNTYVEYYWIRTEESVN